MVVFESLVFEDPHAGVRSVALEQFVAGLDRSTEVNGLFTLVGEGFLFNSTDPDMDRGKHFFVRPAYADLLVQIYARWFPESDQGPVPVLLTGTGGNGKTTFRNLVCKRILERFVANNVQPVTIILQQGDKAKYYVIELWKEPEVNEFRCSCATFMHSDGCFLDDRKDGTKLIYYLVDCPAGDNRMTSTVSTPLHRAIYFSSPNELLSESLRKNKKGSTLFTPLWSEPELQDARAVLNILTGPIVRERYKMIGGMARLCWKQTNLPTMST